MALFRGSFRQVHPVITEIRELSRADLSHLHTKREPTIVQNMKDTHHRIARCLVSGMSQTETAAVCGMTIARISVLRENPAFNDLLTYYRSLVSTEWAQQDSVTEYLRTNALKAQAMISDKLDEAIDRGEHLPTRDLLNIAEMGLDRTGYGKQTKALNVNVDFAANLEEARRRIEGRTIEAQPNE